MTLLVIIGVSALLYPVVRRFSRQRIQARLIFLRTRLKGQGQQLTQTTAKKFPTDYQRLLQQITLDIEEVSELLKSKQKLIPKELAHVSQELIAEIVPLLPNHPLVNQAEVASQLEDQKDSQILSPDISQLAPEIWERLQNIEMDDRMIRQKIEELELANKQELLAVHEVNMGRYHDILGTYLKIKASPNYYYQEEERLEKSRQALEKFDLTLDETLRQINEGDMMNFEISLRLLLDKEK